MHETGMVCLEEYRAQHRAGMLTEVRRREERAMEAMAIGYERIRADLPEMAALRACHEGVKSALADIGVVHGALIQLGVAAPVELFTAQSDLAAVGACLGELLSGDLVENRDHRRVVSVLRDGEVGRE